MKYFLALALLLIPFRLFAAATEWVDFTLHNGHVYLPVNVAGVDTRVLLDSGSQVHAINRAFVSKNKLSLPKGAKMFVKGIHSTEKRTTYNNVKINLFGVEFELDSVVEFNLGHHSSGLLLGASFFQPFITQINYPAKQIRLLTRDAVDMSKVANVNSMDSRATGMPIAEIAINGNSFWFLVDTGSNAGILMERRFASQAGLLEAIEGSTSSRGVNTSGEQEVATAKTIQFGPFEIADVKVHFPAPGETTNLESQYSETSSRIKGRRVVGVIGYGLFQHFVLTIDYQTGKIHVALPTEE